MWLPMKTLHLGLVGSGLQHSRMPALQEYLSKLAGISIDYQLVDSQLMENFNPLEFVARASAAGYVGLNITHPYKQLVASLATRPGKAGHEKIGSYNTLRFEGDDILGTNTDYSGFIRAYESGRNESLPGRVYIAGAGGVGRAVAMALGQLGCQEILVYDQNNVQSTSLVQGLIQQGIQASVVSEKDVRESIKSADGLVNCTQMGMHGHPGSAIDPELIGAQQWAFDAVYTPLETLFLTTCREQGLDCLTGFDLWINQGLDAFTVFTGKELQLEETFFNSVLGWF